MARTACEHALSRVLGYLRLCDVPMSRDVRLAALRLVEDVVAESADGTLGEDCAGVIEQVMQRFKQRFELSLPALPEVVPPLCRGSIHYEDSP